MSQEVKFLIAKMKFNRSVWAAFKYRTFLAVNRNQKPTFNRSE